MVQLNLPPYNIKVKNEDGRRKIFDILRRKYFVITPEEWVRQHFIHFLIDHKGYPVSLLANEVALSVGDKVIRADSVLYDKNLSPRMIIEYKAPHIKLTQKVFDQISAYNLLLHVDYLIVSNGIETYICKMDYAQQTYVFLETVPDYKSLDSNNSKIT
jgi:type I restriction enzyme hsdR protein N-terminal domain protein